MNSKIFRKPRLWKILKVFTKNVFSLWLSLPFHASVFYFYFTCRLVFFFFLRWYLDILSRTVPSRNPPLTLTDQAAIFTINTTSSQNEMLVEWLYLSFGYYIFQMSWLNVVVQNWVRRQIWFSKWLAFTCENLYHFY